MTHADAWGGLDPLRPRRSSHPRRVLCAVQLELEALVRTVPGAEEDARADALEDAHEDELTGADASRCRAWVASVIRALPTEIAITAEDEDGLA